MEYKFWELLHYNGAAVAQAVSKFGDGGPTLWPEQMLATADLNLELFKRL
jgi:hypothetical protein